MYKHTSQFAQAMREKTPKKHREPPRKQAINTGVYRPKKVRKTRMTDEAWFTYLNTCKANKQQPTAVPQRVFDLWIKDQTHERGFQIVLS